MSLASRLAVTTGLFVGSKTLRSRGRQVQPGNRRSGGFNDVRVEARETGYGSAKRDNPLKGEPCTWLWGETNPQGRWWEKTVEGVRNTEDGTKFGSGTPGTVWTTTVDVAKRARQLQGRRRRMSVSPSGGVGFVGGLRESFSVEDVKSVGAQPTVPAVGDGDRRAVASGCGNTNP